MSTVKRSFHGEMEGQGQYNKHAKLPADGAALALSLLERAANDVDLGLGEEPIVIADYGSSQGKNSMVPLQVVIEALRKRVEPNRAITVFHIDQPSNDFNSSCARVWSTLLGDCGSALALRYHFTSITL